MEERREGVAGAEREREKGNGGLEKKLSRRAPLLIQTGNPHTHTLTHAPRTHTRTHTHTHTHTHKTQALLALVRHHGIGAVNLVNKAKADPLLNQIRTIKVRGSDS